MRSIKNACFALLLTSSLTIPIAAQDTPNNLFDGFTSASKRLTIKGGQVDTSGPTATVSVTWWEWYADDNEVNEYLLMWGTQPGVYSDTLNLEPYTEKIDNVAVIEGLTKNTTYYAQFWRVYEEEKKVATEFLITTTPVSVINNRIPDRQLSLSEKITDIALYSIDGRQIALETYTSPNALNGVLSKVPSPGTYVLSYCSGKKPIRTEQILINQ